jgi:zinc and cadmium transporter
MDTRTWIYTLSAVSVVSLVSLVGALTLSRDRDRLERLLGILVSLAAGVLLGGAVVHLLPEAVQAMGNTVAVSVLFLTGFLGFFLLEGSLWQHHHHFGEEPKVPQGHKGHQHPVVAMTLVGDGIHNFIDGMVIAAAFSADPRLGLVTTIAVVAHEVPQEMGDFGVLVFGGLSPRRALTFNFLTAATAIAGALVVLGLGGRFPGFASALLPVTAGSFLYIAAADLIPELHRHETPRSERLTHTLTLLGGVALMVALRLGREALGG